jgi:Carboxypeptidase regulatory-like domain
MLLNQQRARRRMVPRRYGPPPSPGSSPTSIIPYDYAAKFELRGIPGNIVQDVINISVEGVFVAVAIGYGFEEERGQLIDVPVAPPPTLGAVTLGEIPIETLITGFRLEPRLGLALFPDEQLAPSFRSKLFQRVKPPEEISFLFNIVDSATGRELQDEPTHNLASLGKSNGERPFRLLAQPLAFQPRSTIRLQIIEQSDGVRGTLFIVLYGYKILAAGCAEPLVRTVRGSQAYPTEIISSPSARVVPFDYVARLDLIGRPKNIVETEVPINVEGGFVATALGYGLAVEERNVIIQSGTQGGGLQGVLTDDIFTPISGLTVTLRNVASKTDRDSTTGFNGNFGASLLIPGEYEVRVSQGGVPRIAASKVRIISNAITTVRIIMKSPGFLEVRSATIDLSQLPLRQFSLNVLTDGFRIRPNFLRIAFDNSGVLTSGLPVNLLDSVFEPLNRPEDVSFRYRIFDSGTGRELENQPINNIAGLGIANGDRPFKRFARPMIFLPRSTIRITIEEHFGRGTLFFVFQGYKILGAPSVGGRS